MKRVSENSETMLNTPTSILQGCQKKKKEKEIEKIFQEVIAQNIPNMERESLTQIQEAEWVRYKINPRGNTPRDILIKLTKIKDKENILKAAREKKQVTYKGTPIRLLADFSAETLKGVVWYKVMKGKNLQPRLLYPARLSFRFEGETKSFTDKQKLREFSNTKPALQQILKELL